MIDTSFLFNFRSENWVKLSPSQRLSTLQSWENLQAVHQGRPARIVTTFQPGPKQMNTNGYYTSNDPRFLNINQDRLLNNDDPEMGYKVMKTTAHEGRHGFQDDCRNGTVTSSSVDQKTVETWDHNLGNDKGCGYLNEEHNGLSDDQNYVDYRFQPVEDDANSYAQSEVDRYAPMFQDDPAFQDFQQKQHDRDEHWDIMARDFYGDDYKEDIKEKMEDKYEHPEHFVNNHDNDPNEEANDTNGMETGNSPPPEENPDDPFLSKYQNDDENKDDDLESSEDMDSQGFDNEDQEGLLTEDDDSSAEDLSSYNVVDTDVEYDDTESDDLDNYYESGEEILSDDESMSEDSYEDYSDEDLSDYDDSAYDNVSEDLSDEDLEDYDDSVSDDSGYSDDYSDEDLGDYSDSSDVSGESSSSGEDSSAGESSSESVEMSE